MDSRIQPGRQFVTVILGLSRPDYLGSKDGEDGIRRIASFKGAKKWITGKVFSSFLLIGF
jgi:hypothetical protein